MFKINCLKWKSYYKSRIVFSLLIVIFEVVFLCSTFICEIISKVNHIPSLHGLPSIAFFTIQSNIIIFLFYLVYLFCLVKKKRKIFYFLNNGYLKGMITTWICFTGLIFTFILYPFALATIHEQANFFFILKFHINSIGLHMLIPILVVIEFVTFKFISKIYPILIAITWYCYPGIYGAFAIIIGQFTNKYPYFFLNYNSSINKHLGYGYALILWFVVIFLIFIPIIAFFIFINKKRYCKMDQLMNYW